MKFPGSAKTDINNIINKEESNLQNLLRVEKQVQQRLPKNFQDMRLIEQYKSQIKDIASRRDNVVSSSLFNDILIVQCGRFIKYLMMADNEPVFQDADIEFDSNVEIAKIWSTCKKKELQIVANDYDQNILIILTWDFKLNIEVSMLQVQSEDGTRPENYIVRGMNKKMNYFVSKH